MKFHHIIISVLIAIVLIVGALLTINTSLRIRVLNPSYWRFVHHGGNFEEPYGYLIIMDPKCDEIATGLNKLEILKKYPQLVDGKNMNPELFKGKISISYYSRPDIIGIYWFDKNEEKSDACIIIHENPLKNQVMYLYF